MAVRRQFHIARLTEDFRREIGFAITNELRDPRVPGLTTVTEVKLAADTRNATVFVSVYGDEKDRKGALIALNRAAPFIQKLVAQRISVRHFPRMCFKLDSSLDRSQRITELLTEVHDDLV